MRYLELFLAVYGAIQLLRDLRKFFFPPKQTLTPKKIAKISDEELSQYEYGIVEEGLKVYVFNIETEELAQTYDDRFRSSRELDPDQFHQVKAYTGIHAVAKFKKWKENAWKKKKD